MSDDDLEELARVDDLSGSPARPSRRTTLGMIAVAYAVVVAIGMSTVVAHDLDAGAEGAAPASWPGTSQLERSRDGWTLVMLAHPQCSCTRASLAELAIVMSRAPSLAAHVLFVRPDGARDGWESTDTWRSAVRIPGVRVSVDRGGVEAARFGARTSGQVVLYDRAGQLRFEGGITPGRSHIGDNAGRRRVLEMVAGAPSRTPVELETAVFGCALEDEEAAARVAALEGSIEERRPSEGR